MRVRKMTLAKLRNFIKEKKGFVLVDSMVAVLILAIGLAALAFLYTNGTGTLHKSDTREKAVQIAADWVEVIKTWSASNNNSSLTMDTLQNYIRTTLPKDKSSSVTTTTDNEKFTVSAEIMETNYNSYFKKKYARW
jgi:Tfp pilus assembly protein PilV